MGEGIVVGVGVSAGVSVGSGVVVGVGVADEAVKVIDGLLLLTSVIVKLPVSSCIVKVSVPAFAELTEKEACPLEAWIVTGALLPFTVKLESLEVWEIVKLSFDTAFLSQSRIVTVKLAEVPVLTVVEDGG